MKKTSVISLSGGMDSTSLLINILQKGYNVYGVSFDYGQKHKEEIKVLQKNICYLNGKGFDVKHKILDLSDLSSVLFSSLTSESEIIPKGHYNDENMASTVVPNRNAIFSSIIYAYALSLSKKLDSNVDVFLGVHSGDHTIYPDCRPEFYESIEKSFKIGNWGSEKVNFNLPFLNFDKYRILENCLQNCQKLNLDFDFVLSNTLTSYNAKKGVSTGTSGADIERIEAFIKLGRKDPIQYEKSWEEVVSYAKKILHIT